jgi:hypothetical protein
MSRPPDLTGDARTDRALVTLARLLAEIAEGGSGTAAIATDDEPSHPCNDSQSVGEKVEQSGAPQPLMLSAPPWRVNND